MIIALILLLIALILVMVLYTMPLKMSIAVIFMSLLSIPLYKLCMKHRKRPAKHSFWAKVWYENKCQYALIIYGIMSAYVIVLIAK